MGNVENDGTTEREEAGCGEVTVGEAEFEERPKTKKARLSRAGPSSFLTFRPSLVPSLPTFRRSSRYFVSNGYFRK